MPIVEVTYASDIEDDALRRLAELLPHEVSLAVECPEEPYDHDLQPGDVELRFRGRSPFDAPGLDVVIEVRSTLIESRGVDRQERAEQVRAAAVEVLGSRTVGVFLTLSVAGWAQG
ncbi:hypothetical protein NPS01_35050 [Nocardioides psychrotolerans]|uniref:Tautomerase enzyme n=1 Tax=Nocardioides psychrotolerans TaxID=1005945 RepID=A0A1I3PSI3_9ACTN|nr:hypothetical protein [Nocardioides psychrotolerans]GEP39842.1 hypothetical protein NPS01_35050 [Nocardioides psychrotolerans]SFJ24493.1 hypothetical protein SAMN05216561_1221 [Nocardioides psychrotolerans]